MQRVRPDEQYTIWDYHGRENFLVIPITKFIRKDGAVTFVHPLAKQAEERFPKLSAKWGWMLSKHILGPTHRTRYMNLIGLPDREHYASQASEVCIRTSLLFLNELSWDNLNYVFYLDGYLGGEEFAPLHKELLTSDGIVVLVSHNSNEDELYSEASKGEMSNDRYSGSMS